jgi:hypothetical protein
VKYEEVNPGRGILDSNSLCTGGAELHEICNNAPDLIGNCEPATSLAVCEKKEDLQYYPPKSSDTAGEGEGGLASADPGFICCGGGQLYVPWPAGEKLSDWGCQGESKLCTGGSRLMKKRS